MTEQISNKELAEQLRMLKDEDGAYVCGEGASFAKLAAERLAAMPDVGDGSPDVVRILPGSGGQYSKFLHKEENSGFDYALKNKEEFRIEYFYSQPQQPAPDKETIKRHCLGFAEYLDHKGFDHPNGTIFDACYDFLEQQSAEGGE